MGKVKRTKSDPKTSFNARIGFIGSGKMTESIVTGLINHGDISPSRIVIAAPSSNNSDRLKKEFGAIRVTKRNLDVFGKYEADVVFIAVNGNVIRHLYKLGGIRPAPLCTNYIPNLKKQQYVLSLVSGFGIANIRDCLLNPEHPEKYTIEFHRIMLNCAVAHGLGVCAIDVEPDSSKLADPIRALLSSISKLEYVPEGQIDAACAVLGCGLSFSYYFLNSISDGALKIGMSRASAIKFAAKTVSCATNILLNWGGHPNELKDEVCGPSGAAIYGVAVLDKGDVSSGVASAVEAAYRRAISLAKEDNPQ